MGFAINVVAGKTLITKVTSGSLAEENGVKVNMQIRSLNGSTCIDVEKATVTALIKDAEYLDMVLVPPCITASTDSTNVSVNDEIMESAGDVPPADGSDAKSTEEPDSDHQVPSTEDTLAPEVDAEEKDDTRRDNQNVDSLQQSFSLTDDQMTEYESIWKLSLIHI